MKLIVASAFIAAVSMASSAMAQGNMYRVKDTETLASGKIACPDGYVERSVFLRPKLARYDLDGEGNVCLQRIGAAPVNNGGLLGGAGSAGTFAAVVALGLLAGVGGSTSGTN